MSSDTGSSGSAAGGSSTRRARADRN
jgi:hypothetical protein